jgi:hypothetical protein
MDPKSYPPQKSEVTYPLSSIYVSSQGPISIDVPGGNPKVVNEGGPEINDSSSSDDTSDIKTDEENTSTDDSQLGWGAEEGISPETEIPTEDGTSPDSDDGSNEDASPGESSDSDSSEGDEQ